MMRMKQQDPENHGNKELMAAVTGALWKLSMSEDNVKCFQVPAPPQSSLYRFYFVIRNPVWPNWWLDKND